MKEMISDSSSNVSSMRVMSLFSIFIAAGLAFYGLHKGSDMTGLTALVGVFMGGGMGGKVWQKYAETKETTAIKEEVK